MHHVSGLVALCDKKKREFLCVYFHSGPNSQKNFLFRTKRVSWKGKLFFCKELLALCIKICVSAKGKEKSCDLSIHTSTVAMKKMLMQRVLNFSIVPHSLTTHSAENEIKNSKSEGKFHRWMDGGKTPYICHVMLCFVNEGEQQKWKNIDFHEILFSFPSAETAFSSPLSHTVYSARLVLSSHFFLWYIHLLQQRKRVCVCVWRTYIHTY